MKMMESKGIVIDSRDGGVCLSNGRPYWDPTFERIVRDYLGDFCPEVDVNWNVGGGADNFEATFKMLDREGREICGTSKSIAEKGVKIPEKELSLFLSKLSEFHQSANSGAVGNLGDIREFIQNFKVPDPRFMQEAWRVSQTDEHRLIVLWGYYDQNRGANSVVLPQSNEMKGNNRIDIVQRVRDAFAVSPASLRPWWIRWLRYLLILMALPLLLSFFVYIGSWLFGMSVMPEWMLYFHPFAIQDRFFPEELFPSVCIKKEGEKYVGNEREGVCQPHFYLDFVRSVIALDREFSYSAEWVDIEIMENGTEVSTNYFRGMEYRPSYTLKNGHINNHVIVVRGETCIYDFADYDFTKERARKAYETKPFYWQRNVRTPQQRSDDEVQSPGSVIPPNDNGKGDENPKEMDKRNDEYSDGATTNVLPKTEFKGTATNDPPVVSSPKNEDRPMPSLDPEFVVKLEGKEEYEKIGEASWGWRPKFQLRVRNVEQGSVAVNGVNWIDVECLPDGLTKTNIVPNASECYNPVYKVLKGRVNRHLVMARGYWEDLEKHDEGGRTFVTNPCCWGDDKNSQNEDSENEYIPQVRDTPPVDNEEKNDVPDKNSRNTSPKDDQGRHSENGDESRDDGTLVCELHNEPFVNGECRARCPICRRHLDVNRKCPDVCLKHPEVHKSLSKGLCPECDGEIIGEEKCWIDVKDNAVENAPWNVRFSLWTEDGKMDDVSWEFVLGAKYNGESVGRELDAVQIIKKLSEKYGSTIKGEVLNQPFSITGRRKVVVDGRQIEKNASVIWKMSLAEKEREGVERHIRLCGKNTDEKGNSYFIFRIYSNPHDSSAKTTGWTIRLSEDVIDGKRCEEMRIPCYIEEKIGNAVRLYIKDIPRNGRLKVEASVAANGTAVRNIEGNFIFQAGAITASSSFNSDLVERAKVIADMMQRSIPLVRTSRGWGTAFAISSKQLLTNEHVVKGDEDKTIFLRIPDNGASYMEVKARVVKSDSSIDLALLEVIDGYEFKNPLPWGYRKARVGENVSVLGYPYDANQQFAHAEGRILKVTDTQIGHEGVVWNGNSGGPLVSVETGEVLGVTNAYAYKDENGERYALASIAIPADMANRFVSDR